MVVITHNPKSNVFLQPRMSRRGPFSIEVESEAKVSGETRPRRHPKAKDGLFTQPDPSIKTAYDIVLYSARKYGNARCMGSRPVLNIHKEKKEVDGVEKEWQYFELGQYTYLSYNDLKERVGVIGSALKHLGLNVKDKIHLYGATSLPWLTMAQGAFTQNLTLVTAYDTLGLDGLRASIQQTESRAIYIDGTLLDSLLKILADTPSLESVVINSTSPASQTALDKISKDFPQVRVLRYDDLLALGKEHPAEQVPPTADDLACIMYTSGTSGTPKGVTILHKAIVSSISGATSIVGDYLGPDDAMLAYLPLAHIIEFVFENASIYWGAVLGYGSPKTLTDASVRNCKGDLTEFRPTVLVGVPAVWESIKKGVITKVQASGGLKQKVFWTAMSAKQSMLAAGIPGSWILDKVVLGPVRAAAGGRLRIGLSGGGAVAKETQQFVSTAFAPIIGGYGMTETSGMGALCDPFNWTADAVGDIPAAVEVKLVDHAEAGYLSTNQPPQGEIWIRGDPVTRGYYGNEEETKAACRPDGWFLTGDIGEFDRNGQLKVIDRKKNLVKTLNGEYIALEKLESVYRASSYVANICVYAAGDRNKPLAIIVPAEPAVKKLAADNGISGGSWDELVMNQKLNKLVLSDLQRTGKQAGLSGMEIIDGVVFDTEEWTPQNGFLTAAQKLLRKKVVEKNKAGIDKAYGKK